MIINLRTKDDAAVLSRISELYPSSRLITDGRGRLIGKAHFSLDDGRPLFIMYENDIDVAEKAVVNGYNVVMLGEADLTRTQIDALIVTDADENFPFAYLAAEDLAATGDLVEELLGL